MNTAALPVTPNIELTEEQFFEQFRPVKNYLQHDHGYDACLFAPDSTGLFFVRSVLNANPECVWTVHHDFTIVDGYSTRDVLGYFVTDVPCPSNTVVFVNGEEDDDEFDEDEDC